MGASRLFYLPAVTRSVSVEIKGRPNLTSPHRGYPYFMVFTTAIASRDGWMVAHCITQFQSKIADYEQAYTI